MWGTLFSGVDRKIHSQVKSLSDLGLTSEIVLICDNNSQVMPDKFIKIVPMSIHKTGFNIFSKMMREHSINTVLDGTITSLLPGDILYMRPPYPTYFLSTILKAPRSGKVVIEFQDIEPLEYRLERKYWYILIDIMFGTAIRKYPDAIIGVTDEITRYQVARSGDPDKPHITIGNGIDVNSVKIRKSPPYGGNELHLLCVSHVDRWNGLDRVLRGLAEYNGPARVTLHIAGDGSELIHLKKISGDLGIEGKVLFHGYLRGQSLDELYDRCHIAVGSMGSHRKGLSQSSQLKIREYCAKGIPFILSGTDLDFSHDKFPYLQEFSADDTPIDIETIVRFANNVLADPEHHLKIRQYATEHLDWSVKMKQLKEFLHSLVNE